MTEPRRILIVAPWVPSPTSGFGTRVFQLSAALGRRHHVSVLCHSQEGDEGAIGMLREGVSAVHTVAGGQRRGWGKRGAQAASLLAPASFQGRQQASKALQSALDRLLARETFDLVQLESAHLGGLSVRGGIPVVLDEHNIEYELLERVAARESLSLRKVYDRVEATRVRRGEQRLWGRIAGCALTSEREAALVRAMVPSAPVGVVPNGVDLEYFRPQPGTAVDPGSMVFVGTMHYQPNADAAAYFIERVLPRLVRDRPGLVFSAVGHRPPAELACLSGPGVVIAGSVDDVRLHMAGAAVVVAPLRTGGGTRLKILEAMAMGRPVVSTTIGCEGLDVRDGEHLLVADGPACLSEAIGRLLDDRGLATRLGVGGRALVEARYGWDRAAQSLEELHSRVLSGGVGPVA